MFLVLLALVAILGYVLFSGSTPSSFASPQSPAQTEQSVVDAGLALAKDYAVNSALSSAGLKLTQLPSDGCSQSVLEPTKVLDLLATMEEPYRTALASILDTSSPVWTVQVYQGAEGSGLCLPVQSKLLVFPANQSSQQDVGRLLSQLQSALTKQ